MLVILFVLARARLRNLLAMTGHVAQKVVPANPAMTVLRVVPKTDTCSVL